MTFTIPEGFEFPALSAVRPAMMIDQSMPEFPGLRGSCTLLTINKKYYVVCTGHQFGFHSNGQLNQDSIFEPLFVSHHGDNSLNFIAVRACYIATDGGNEEYHDILIFETKSTDEIKNFFPLENFRSDQRLQSLMIGCPLTHCAITCDPISVSFTTQGVVCTLDHEFESNSRFLKRFTFDHNVAENPNGFSGGAVFSLFEDGVGRASVCFDGIVTRAGNGNAYVVDANFLFGLASRI
jgi:hypothetical protein